ncbi:MAG: hypothetical protein JEZ11_27985, partial [Desulfobacterales bacterium]|nr:hypothetical protein [Desulfobacterales bacterium]
ADLDALFGGGDTGVEAAVEMAEADADPAPEAAPEESGSLNQADLDALFGGGDTGVEAAVEMAEADADPAPEAAPEESGSLNQADLDALFGGGDTGVEAAVEMAEADADPAPETMPEESGSLNQADLDALFGGGDTGAEAANDLSDSDPFEAVDSAFDEDNMDRLISDLTAELVAESASGEKPLEAGDDGPEPVDDKEGPGIDFEVVGSQAGAEEDDDFVGLDDDEMEMGGYEAGEADSKAIDPEAQDLPTGTVMGEAAEVETSPAETPVKRKGAAKVTSTPSAGRFKAVVIAVAVLLLLVGGIGGGAVYLKWQSVTPVTKTEPNAPVEGQKAPKKASVDKSVPDKAETTLPTAPLPSGVQKGLADLDVLRQQMVAKKAEIDALKIEYLEKMRQAEGRILVEAQKRGITTLKEALAVRQMELALRTVQRRMAYVRKLNEPAARLSEGSEALLFVKRLTEIDGYLADVSKGLDADILEKRLIQAMDRYRIEPVDLVVDIEQGNYPGLEDVWKPIAARMKKGPPKPAPVSPAQVAKKKAQVPASLWDNEQILEEIVAKKFDHVFHLTQLTPEAARSLSDWRNKELFLNDLSHLSSQEAAYLAKWHGNWMALNGLKALSVDVARHLMNWQGDRLSLNGLEEIDADAARYLAQWRGSQIELAGLRRLSPAAAKLLSQWQKNGGRVFVPEHFQRQKVSATTVGEGPATTKKD